MNASASLQIPATRFDNMIHKVLMSATTRRKAAWEAWASASTSSYTKHFTGEGAALDNAAASSSSDSGSDGGGQVLDGVDTSSTSGSGRGGPVIDVSRDI
jgi:hypothetical protein